jgi:hypothetical protein
MSPNRRLPICRIFIPKECSSPSCRSTISRHPSPAMTALCSMAPPVRPPPHPRRARASHSPPRSGLARLYRLFYSLARQTMLGADPARQRVEAPTDCVCACAAAAGFNITDSYTFNGTSTTPIDTRYGGQCGVLSTRSHRTRAHHLLLHSIQWRCLEPHAHARKSPLPSSRAHLGVYVCMDSTHRLLK